MATQLAPAADEPLDTGQDTGEEQSGGDRDFEAEARAQGWTDADSFKGDKTRWVDAETFVKRSDEVMPLLKKQLSHYRAELDMMKREIKRVRKSEQASYDNAYADLKAKMENAVVTGNVAAFKELDAKADQLRKDMAEDTPPADQQKEAVRAFAEWRDSNEWYDLGGLAGATDIERRQRAYFDRMVEAHEDKAQTMAPTEFISMIGELVEAKYPAERAARPRATESVAGVTRTGAARSNAQTYANLPAEAKAQADRFHANGIYKGTLAEAREKYAKSFDWSSLK